MRGQRGAPSLDQTGSMRFACTDTEAPKTESENKQKAGGAIPVCLVSLCLEPNCRVHMRIPVFVEFKDHDKKFAGHAKQKQPRTGSLGM